MAVTSFSQFSEMHQSVLQELGNMGSGSAATALAGMIGTPTDISCPIVRFVGKNEAGTLISALSGATASLLISLSGDFKGSILHIMPYKYVERLIGCFFPGAVINSGNDIDEMGWSVINEVVNITTGAYVNALSQLSGMFIDISTPNHTPDASREILNVYPADEGTVCFVNNTLIIKDQNVMANMLYFPELESVKSLMTTIGVEC